MFELRSTAFIELLKVCTDYFKLVFCWFKFTIPYIFINTRKLPELWQTVMLIHLVNVILVRRFRMQRDYIFIAKELQCLQVQVADGQPVISIGYRFVDPLFEIFILQYIIRFAQCISLSFSSRKNKEVVHHHDLV